MEQQQTPIPASTQNTTQTNSSEFAPGTPVVYGMHGRCNVQAIETRVLGDQSIRFYKLEIQKSTLSRSTRQEPAIWVPVATAKEQGLRAPMTTAEAEAVMKTISSREYFFPLNDGWSQCQTKVENAIKSEGAIGLAKVVSFLHVLRRKQVVPTSETNKMYEATVKVLLRELSETLNEPIRSIEDKVSRGLKQKLIPDT